MKSLWSDEEAARYPGELGQRVYTSRLLGRDKSLVLHGGGNTSVKVVEKNLLGDEEALLYVKGSGWDLATIEAKGFSPVRMAPLLRLARLPAMTDAQMENELVTSMTRAGSPTPSVETILHAILPCKFVDHTHADAVISVTNSPGGLQRIQEIYGDSVVIVPYIMPGFDLARLCAEIFPRDANPRTIGMVLMNHGIFSFGDTARESYERMIDLVSRAETYLQSRDAWSVNAGPPAPLPLNSGDVQASSAGLSPSLPEESKEERAGERRDQLKDHADEGTGSSKISPLPSPLPVRASRGEGADTHFQSLGLIQRQGSPVLPAHENRRKELAALRRELSSVAGFPIILETRSNAHAMAFAQRPDVGVIARQGPATPDHVIRTKRLPLVGRDARQFAEEYRKYFAEHAPHAKQKLTMLDPAPRVVLDKEFGLCTVGRTVTEAAVCAEIYEHTMEIILRATALGGWCALPARDIFDVEYWELEQAKLARKGRPPVFAGEIALVTGAASGIGKACVDSLLKRGAAVVGLDINPAIRSVYARADFLGIECDLTKNEMVAQALETAVSRYGGLDMLVLNAGIFPAGCAISELSDELWRKVMGLNLDANLALMRECHPLLQLAPNGGRVVVIGSKNVPAPGPGAAAYSASKAAMNQLARVAALEWGRDRIRVNSIHPNQVFDTGLWTQEVLESRARHYGLTVEQYKTNNVLQTEIKSADVAELAAEMCGPLFAKTTGAQVPVDGGNDRVI